MIVHSISWWCKNGASHRKNFDTPPLKGSCGESARIHGNGPATSITYGRDGFIRIHVDSYEFTPKGGGQDGAIE